jgi:hypothetical protein
LTTAFARLDLVLPSLLVDLENEAKHRCGHPNVDVQVDGHPFMAPSLAERLSALDRPDHMSDETAMWTSVRPMLVLGRIVMVLFIIAVGEIFDEVRVRGLSIGVWALIAGIPLFLLLSMVITYGDRLTQGEGNTP